MNVSIVIPFLNEEESIPKLSEWIGEVMVSHKLSYEIIWVDDGSTDSSWQIVEQLSNENKLNKGIKFRRNYGKSAALNSGFEVVEGGVVITMDADLQDSPEEIPALYDMIMKDGYDLVSGWKKKRHDPISKRWPSKVYNAINRKITGIQLHDFNCGLKAYKKVVVKNIEVYGEMHRFIPVIAKWAGFLKITEKVVSHQKRKYGKTKFGLERYRRGFLDLLSITFVSRFGKRPMHLFGSLGTILFLIGLGIAFYLIYAKIFMMEYAMTERPMFYFGILSMILGSQLFMTGFLSEMVSRNSTERNKYQISNKIGLK
ncbi:MAG: glycosyltransferase [Bacteroidetes bacterium]|nr:glycosyltransferase [Bacteroidota bacterium]